MKATCWMGRNTVEVENVPDPKILNDRDAIVRITSTAICGSDLHLFDGYVPTMKKGDIMGHEFMGEVVEKGRGVANLEVGDRVVVPFPIACGDCCVVPARALLALRELEPERAARREDVRLPDRGHLRLLAPHRRLRRRPGRVRARAVRRRRADQDRERPLRRAGAVPLGHPADRLHGRRVLRHPRRRGRSPSGAPAPSASSQRERADARRRARHRDRPLRLPAADGAREPRRRHAELRGGRQRPGGAEGADRRARARRVHRRRRHGGALPRTRRTPTTA